MNMKLRQQNPARLIVSLSAGAFLSIVSASVANAQIFSDTESGTFGSLDQNNPIVTPANVQNVACVPTSVANGLTWLENTYSVPNLLQSSPEESGYPTVNTLITDMGTTAGAGTSFANEVAGLSTYLGPTGQNVASQVSFSGQVSGGVAGYNQIQNSYPTAMYLYNALVANDAVEFWINWYNPTTQQFANTSHSLTLTGISFNAGNGTGTLSFTDPFGTGSGAVTIASATFQTITSGGTSYLYINGGYTGGAANNGLDPDNSIRSSVGAITTDLVEAAPEPGFGSFASLFLLMLGLSRLPRWRAGRAL